MSAALLAFIATYIGPSSSQGKTREPRAPATFRRFEGDH